MKKLLPLILCFIVVAAVLGVGTSFTNGNNATEQIVQIDEKTTTLTKEQMKSLDSGADITYDSDVYRLSKVGDEKIYEHTDGENIFLTKYIGVDTKKRTFRTWEKLNSDVVTKALMNSALTEKDSALKETLKEYVTDDQMTEILTEYEKGADLTETLKKYVTEEKVNSILSSYYTKQETQNLINQALLSYVKKSDGKGLVQMSLPGQLTFKVNTMYAVQCFDPSGNLADFKIVGGGKDGKTGRFALVFVGEKISESLTLYQTGSVLISDLAATSGGSTGIKPASSGHHLRVFELGGKVF